LGFQICPKEMVTKFENPILIEDEKIA